MKIIQWITLGILIILSLLAPSSIPSYNELSFEMTPFFIFSVVVILGILISLTYDEILSQQCAQWLSIFICIFFIFRAISYPIRCFGIYYNPCHSEASPNMFSVYFIIAFGYFAIIAHKIKQRKLKKLKKSK